MAKQILQRYGTAADLNPITGTAGTNREIALVVDGSGIATGDIRVMDGVTKGGIVIAPQTLLSNYYEAAAQLTGGNDVSDGRTVPELTPATAARVRWRLQRTGQAWICICTQWREHRG